MQPKAPRFLLTDLQWLCGMLAPSSQRLLLWACGHC